MLTLKAGDKAYLDSFIGLIACRVVSIEGTSGIASTAQRIKVAVTGKKAERYGYRQGEIVERSGLSILPRGAAKFRKYGTAIVPYHVEVTPCTL